MKLIARTIVACFLTALASCAPARDAKAAVAVAPAAPGTSASGAPANVEMPPAAPREFRAVWVASVNNGQWPSKPGLSVAEQKQELLGILDRAAALNVNAVVLQVRPAADALYPSELEPWSEFLTGVQGQPPAPFYDPLQMWIDEAHKRGMELHAWFNPYRARSDRPVGPISNKSIAKTHPEVVKKYGNYLWMDPGEPLAAQHTLRVILDIVRRYDVDGVHTDDYYYPYQVRESDAKDAKIVDFPDEPSWAKYKNAGGKLARNDWRRDNVNQLVQRIYTEVRRIKPWVKVSYAPFGIWKNGVPAGIKGLSQYDSLYADPKLWLNKGWLDYIAPQLYWKIGGDQDFDKLLKWWLSENTQKRYVWPGMSVSRHPVPEVLNQIALTRQSPLSTGQMIWSAMSVLGTSEKAQAQYAALQRGPYAEKALVPPFPWLDRTPPPAPVASLRKDSPQAVTVTLRPGTGEATFVYSVFVRYGNAWRHTVVPGGAPSITLNADATGSLPSAIVIAAVDRCGNESPRVPIAVK
jgi:uncharacterized lipoprotein YddW (UPF0748 family)